VALHSDGSIFFVDPPFGILPPPSALGFFGIFKIPSPTLMTEGFNITLVSDILDRPNGIAFSPDEKILYVTDTAYAEIDYFQFHDNGTVDGPFFFAEVADGDPKTPNALKTDVNGNVYCTADDGVHIFMPNGSYIGLAPKPLAAGTPMNLHFGDLDNTEIYVTTTTGLYKISGKIAGKQTNVGPTPSPTNPTPSGTETSIGTSTDPAATTGTSTAPGDGGNDGGDGDESAASRAVCSLCF
jgi:gluconolactonase